MSRKYFQLVSAGLSFLLLALGPVAAQGQKSLEIPSGASIRVRTTSGNLRIAPR